MRLHPDGTNIVKIGRGVRQGCCISSILLNICGWYLVKHLLVLSKAKEGLQLKKIRDENNQSKVLKTSIRVYLLKISIIGDKRLEEMQISNTDIFTRNS